jgi:cytochrome c peroxidase
MPGAVVQARYAQQLGQLHAALAGFQEHVDARPVATWPADFRACRTAYKQLEWVVDYHYPYLAQRLNGAALPEVEVADPNEVLVPTGLQVLEEQVFAPDADQRRGLIRRELALLLSLVGQLEQRQATLVFTEENVYDALRLNLYQLAAKGLSGFDSPVAGQSLAEGAVTLQAAEGTLAALGPVTEPLQAALHRSEAVLAAGQADFAGFDRARFLTRCFNPLLAALHQQQVQRQVPFSRERRAVRPGAASFFAADAFDPYFFAPPGTAVATPAVLTLGRRLFSEPLLSVGGRSCAGCHLPGKAYADGLKVSKSLQSDDGLLRNTPTLLNAALQPTLFYDGRVQFLEDQIHDVVSNKAEMNGQLDQIAGVLRQQPAYRKAFAQAFPQEKEPVSEATICRALAAHVRTLVGLNSRFDRYLRGDTTVLLAPELAGFNLFMGKAQCGTCHYLPLFNGSVPPYYLKADGEVLGVPATASLTQPTLDADPGMYAQYRLAHRHHAFKTPTVRNAARTAPYMHNGAYRTLEEVVDFYDQGGGQGLGLAVPNQTLSGDKLHLTAAEKQALVAFIKTLDDK